MSNAEMGSFARMELHTGAGSEGRAICAALPGLDAGCVVGCHAAGGLWLPYLQVGSVDAAARTAQALGACVLAAPRDNDAGRRALIAVAGAPLALWQPAEVEL